MKVLVCGSRKWNDRNAISKVIEHLVPGTQVIAGDATGADYIAIELTENRIDLPEPKEFKADWDSYGLAAGPRRNIEMLEDKPDIVYAFPDNNSKGTWHTVREARKRGIKTVVYGEE